MIARPLLAFAFFALAATSAAAAEFTFAAFGDTPYTQEEEGRFPALIAEMNREELAFVVHVGDFKAAWTRCTDELYAQRREWFDLSRHPFIFVPGDNEWTDCRRFSGGGYDPLERLAKLRELFSAGKESLGRRRFAIARQPSFPEHARWRHEDVMFLSLNVPGPDNNARLMPEEFRARGAAGAAWMKQSFELAEKSGARAVVVFMQANPWGNPSNRYFGFRQLLSDLARETVRFAGQVMVVHGDTHRYRVDRPLRDPASGKPLANFTRVEVFGYPAMNWVRVRVVDDGERVRFEVEPGS